MQNWMDNDREVLARTLMAEAGNQGPLGMLAAGSVIMNRARTPGYGDGVRGVILKPGQFSPWNSVTGYAGGEQGQNMAAIQPTSEAYAIADRLLSGQYEDPTGGATHFYNPDISSPSWGQAAGGDWTRIGSHIFGRAGAGRSSTGDAGMVRGGAGQTSMTGQAGADFLASEQERPRGLLGGFFGPEGRDRRARLAIALEGMTLNPNQAFIDELRGGIERREVTAQKNRTLDYLRNLNTPQAKEALRYAEGTGDITGALKIALTKPDDARTALIKNYEYAVQAGYTGTFEEFLRSGGGGGSVVNVNSGLDEGALQKELGKTLGGDIALSLKNGQQAARNLARYDMLEQLLQSAPQGGRGAFVQMAANFGLKLEGASDIEAAQALINQLVPEQRQPGSGPMSDADLALFKQSLPRIINTPGGNQLILQTLRGIAEYDLRAADIARRLASNQIDIATYLDEMASLENPIPVQILQTRSSPSMSGDDAAAILLGD